MNRTDLVISAGLLAMPVIVVVAAFAQGITGFGFALVAAPLLAVVAGPKESVVALSLIALPMNAWSSLRHRRVACRGVAVRMVAAAAAVAPVGVWLLSVLSDRVLQGVVGVVVLCLTVTLIRGVRVSSRGGLVDLLGGACAGLLSTSTGTNGPPLVIAMQIQGISGPRLRATLAWVFFACGLVSLALLNAAGSVSTESLISAGIGWPFAFVGRRIGERVAGLLAPRWGEGLVAILLFASAATAIVTAMKS
ncbi:sulfite exporter TauE/SafE family protein [Nonomuraea sp. NPDC049152]|uniref:sulfite exporter TauE/SafE family protein n=1 Tax=Nonomuraea sp. NPDC049152 TaxID=3154350 RepID=UPI00340ACEBB